MTGGIYLLQDDGRLVEMVEQSYDSEDLLQTLLARYPALLAGDQMDGAIPRRWVLISREGAVPGDESGGARWSVDHVFLDQDAVPTLVEVKRSSDPRIRHEVVGQMLDYAANAILYWPMETIRTEFEARCGTERREPEQVLRDGLGVEADVEAFWQQVDTNLQAGKVRLVFVADVIPVELRRVVEFLNGQMDPAEVLAVEIRQYVGQGQKSLVPRVFGQTVEAEVKKATSRSGQIWARGSFLDEVRHRLPPAQVAAVERVLKVSEEVAQDLGWGRGQTGSLSPKFPGAGTKSFYTLRTSGELQVNRKWHEQDDAGEEAVRFRDEFTHRLRTGGLEVTETPYPAFPIAAWADKAEVVVRAIRELFGAPRAEGARREDAVTEGAAFFSRRAAPPGPR